MVEVVLSLEARQMLALADAWWFAERGASDNPLWEDVERVSALLRDYPLIGKIYGHKRNGVVVRRRLLQSGWHAYYTYNAARRKVTIVAVRYAGRGGEPGL